MIPADAALGFYGYFNVFATAAHWACMNYVVVGTFEVFRRSALRADETRLETTLRDWLPFAFAVMATSGVPPLLFTLLLRPVRYANAVGLTSSAYFAVVPALIAGWALLWLLRRANGPEARLRRVVSAGLALACFVFVGWTMSRTHVLSLKPELWADVHAGRAEPPDGAARTRTFAWLAWAAASYCALAQWQLGRRERPSRGLAATAIVALHFAMPLSFAAVRATYGETDIPRSFVFVGIVGAGFQTLGWLAAFFGNNGPLVRAALPIGWLVSISSAALYRELATLDAEHLAPFGSEPRPAFAAAQGFGVFLAIFVAVVAACLYVVRVVREVPNEASMPVARGR
jgi:hypothetical protein